VVARPMLFENSIPAANHIGVYAFEARPHVVRAVAQIHEQR
jgi:hypothetical protein